ncbi:hypothetical protein MSAN_00098500 [Mycena sanguinolenta]|uniref:Uncharacterized protein n=1 Tax=Mycena sanguinolenta TaxID=230812 RepID=A0A8H7DMP0_9AGAR|nr:hypothetical protein MSAN_00098500 [Mycena sanguinolenta]
MLGLGSWAIADGIPDVGELQDKPGAFATGMHGLDNDLRQRAGGADAGGGSVQLAFTFIHIQWDILSFSFARAPYPYTRYVPTTAIRNVEYTVTVFVLLFLSTFMSQ